MGTPGPPYQLRPFGQPDIPWPFYPWLAYVPARLRTWLHWEPQKHDGQKPKVVLLYAGPDDDSSLDHILKPQGPMEADSIWAIDLCRGDDHDLLKDGLYFKLCSSATDGLLLGIAGGPMCRTWSILRHIPKPGAPRPVRGRQLLSVRGLPNLTCKEEVKVEGATSSFSTSCT